MEALIVHPPAVAPPMPLIKALEEAMIRHEEVRLEPSEKSLREIRNARLIILLERPVACIDILRTQNPQAAIVYIGNIDSKNKERMMDAIDGFIPDAGSEPDLVLRLKRLVCLKADACITHALAAYTISLDLRRRIALRGHKAICLRNKEFELLEFFILNRDKTLPRDLILEFVWDRNADFASNTLDVHVNRLRRKLGDRQPYKLIHTVHAIGYRFGR